MEAVPSVAQATLRAQSQEEDVLPDARRHDYAMGSVPLTK